MSTDINLTGNSMNGRTGKSPYTQAYPQYSGRVRHTGSPYTQFGPISGEPVQRIGKDLTPYTTAMPRYDGHTGSGESPYTNLGPRHTP